MSLNTKDEYMMPLVVDIEMCWDLDPERPEGPLIRFLGFFLVVIGRVSTSCAPENLDVSKKFWQI
jgi:hypothetical protein